MIPDPKLKVFIDILLELADAGANFSDDDLLDETITMILAVNILNYYFLRTLIKLVTE